MKTTLNKIKDSFIEPKGWEKLLNTLGKTKADDEELSLLTILKSTGMMYTVWCLRAVDGHGEQMREFTRFCVKQNIERIKRQSSKEDFDLISKWFFRKAVIIY